MRLNPSIEGSKTSLNETTTLPRKKNSLIPGKESRHSMIIETSTVALTKSDKLTQLKNETSKTESPCQKPQRTRSDMKPFYNERSKLKKFFSTDLNPFKIHYPQLPAPPAPPAPPPPPPPLPPFSSLRDLPSLASLPSIPNSFVATSINSATFTSTTTDSSNSRNRFVSSTNILSTSNSDSKTNNRNCKSNEKTLNVNNKQITKVVGKIISNKVDKIITKRSDEKLNQEQTNKPSSKQIQKQRMQLYDRINLQNRLKEHTYSPLHFWAEKKNENDSLKTTKKINTKNFQSLDQLNKPQPVNINNTNSNISHNKKNSKNYISYKLKADLKIKNKPPNNGSATLANTKNEVKKKDSNSLAKKANAVSSATKQQKQLDYMTKLRKASLKEADAMKKSITLKEVYKANDEYNYATSQKSITTIESDTSSEEYVSNMRKEYEIKILTSSKNCEDYDHPQFQNEYDDVDDNILEPIVQIRKEPKLSLKETLMIISNSNNKKTNSQCECRIDNKKQEQSKDVNLDDIIACTSF